MNFMFLFAFVAVGAASNLPPDVTQQWENYKKKYGKNYDPAEETAAQGIFKQRMSSISEHNLLADLGLATFREGLNKYSDVEHTTFVKRMNGFKMDKVGATKKGKPFTMLRETPIPDSVNWTSKGYVTPVKDQGSCGSCWSFSATGALEAQLMNATGNLVSLSEQNLVDCSIPQGNLACEGGLMDNAFQYIKLNNGIATEDTYPYTASLGVCHNLLPGVVKVGSCSGYYDIPSGDEDALKKAVATVGPVSVAIDASHDSFQNYASGVYNEPQCDSQNLDHGVLAVGYGTTADGLDYWLIKNSWGTSWGMNGYMMMARNNNNQCGVATMASYPIL